MPRDPHSGVVLVNVLAVLALSSAVLLAMIRVSDIGIARSQTFADAAQARALISAGEASAVSALRRDMRDAPETDHTGEDWMVVAQGETQIEAGTFALTIMDAQARLNLAGVAGTGAVGPQILSRIVALAGLPEETGPRLLARLGEGRVPSGLDAVLRDTGLSADQASALARYVTLLPVRTDININTVPDAMLSVLTDNPVQARNLQSLRARRGFVTPDDLSVAGVVLLPGIGFTSQHFEVTVTVGVGNLRQSQTSLLQRRQSASGQQVAVIRRQPALRP